MFKTPSFESRLAIVKNALHVPTTKKPPVPSERLPKIQQKSAKESNQFFDVEFDHKKNANEQERNAFKLWKSMIMMVGSFIEQSPQSPQSQQWSRTELREFISQVEICLELKPGKLDIDQYGNLMIKLDDIARFAHGELADDLKSLDQIVAAYGNKLAAES